jgi:hypothetical protein
LKKWINEKKISPRSFYYYSYGLDRSFNMGICAKSTGDACAADLSIRDAASHAILVSSLPDSCGMTKRPFPSRKIFLLSAALMLILASIACGASSSPGSTPQPLQPGAPESASTEPVIASTSQPTQIAAAPEIPETRRLTLEFPSKMRSGVEGGIVRLMLEVDDLGNITPTAQIEDNVVVGQTIEIPDLYETHNVTAEARLDMAGMLVQPADAIYEPLKRGQSATFYWSIRPQEPGIYSGTVWLHLNFADKLSGEQSRIAVSAQIIKIKAVDFFGLPVNVVRSLGVIGTFIGGVVGFPFIEDILKFLFKKKKVV